MTWAWRPCKSVGGVLQLRSGAGLATLARPVTLVIHSCSSMRRSVKVVHLAMRNRRSTGRSQLDNYNATQQTQWGTESIA